jgi:hypothetical protein
METFRLLPSALRDISFSMHYMVRDLFRLALVIGGLMTAIWLLWSLNDEGYFYHDKLTTIHAPASWVNGEYKECTSLDVKEADEHPELSCENANDEGKMFNVRFYGRIFAPEQKQVIRYWRCKKINGDDTSITCHMLKPRVPPAM